MASIKVWVDKKLFKVPMKTTLYEISRLVKDDFTYPILAAKVDNVISDLSKELNNDAQVEFYDRTSDIGNRVYARSLEFLTIAAAKRILKENSDILIDYSLSNGIYCEVIGQRINQRTIDNLKETMDEMIKSKFKFKKTVVSRIDAIKYFEKKGQMDKVNNLRYSANTTINLHILDNNYDYFFGPLVHDTGQINIFELIYLRDNSFLINFPNKRKPKNLTPYNHRKLLFEEFKNSQEWGRKVNLQTAPDLNKLSSENRKAESIRLSEAYYERQVALAANEIYKHKNNVKVVLLCGPSSSGKTTTAKKLEMQLKVLGIIPHLISLDDYMIDREKSPKDKDGNYDFSSIKNVQRSLLDKHVQQLFEGKEITLPHFDFVKGKQEYNGKALKLAENDILIIEGIHTFNDKLLENIKDENKFKIFISPIITLKIDNHNRVHTSDVRKLRRMVRDSKFRGFSALDTLKGWPNVVKECHEKIYPYENSADMIINTALNYELGVLRIYAEPLLYAIDENNEYYPEVTRLINLLKNFLPISVEAVPKDSLLREFIGGGIYEEEEKW